MEKGERVKGISLKGIALTILAILGIIGGGIIGQAYGADYLGKITGGEMGSPGRLSAGPEGRLYVADGSGNHVLIYDGTWGYVGEISYDGVSAVATAPDGTLYIGSNKDKSVGVYRGGSITGYIGKDELASVEDIAVDPSTGDIYVVDSKANLVRVYDQWGNTKGALSGLHLPIAVAVEGGEVFVLDAPEVSDPSNPGSMTTGARVSVFDISGNLLRSFEDWEGNGGHLFRPQDIEVDGLGNIYIPDGYFMKVFVYDSAGNYTGEISSQTEQMLIPRSVTLSPDDKRLYVSSNMTRSILVFSLDGTVAMTVTPLSMSFTAQTGAVPASQPLSITNTGTGSMNYMIDLSDSWITLDTATGAVAGGSSATVMVGVNATGLAVGAYNGSITIRNDAGGMETVVITLDVKPAPTLTVSPLSIGFDYTIGGNLPASQPLTISIENDPAGAYSWSATASDAWLTITPASGQGDTVTQVIVGVDVTGLAAGTYTGQIVIEAPGVEGSPAVVTVTLNVYSVGSIHVTTNLSDATFTIEGPGGITYTGSGTEWSVNNVADGTYTITYGDMEGYKTPASETKTLSGGGVLEFNGVYEENRHASTVMILSKTGKKADSTIRIVDATGATVDQFKTLGNHKGGVGTAVADVDGDGANEIIAGQLRDGGTVGLYEADGTEIARFMATMDDEGVRVAGGDLDGDGKAEIIVLVDEENIKVFSYDGSGVVDTGMGIDDIEVESMDTADLNNDGIAELVIMGEAEDDDTVSITVWSEHSGVLMASSGFTIDLKGARYIATGDVNGDMMDDILVSTKSKVCIYSLAGELTGIINAGKKITGLDAGDIDGDGAAEVLVGKKGNLEVYSGAGAELMRVKAFDRKTGVRVSTGDLGL